MSNDPQACVVDDFDDNIGVPAKASNVSRQTSQCESEYSTTLNGTTTANIGTAATNLSSAAPKLSSGRTGFGRSISWFNSRANGSQRNIGYDDENGKSEFFLLLLFQSVGDSGAFLGGCILIVLVWSIICAWGSQWLHELADSNPGGAAERWVEDIENCKNALSIVGTLFVFTLVFRFNACYDRWWESRIFWGDIISKSIELGTMNRNWITDGDLADRMSRFIVVFSYASKAILRGKSLNEDGEEGPALVKRGLLTQEELDDMHDNPCWQPHYCIQMIREILVEAHSVPGGKGLKFDESNKVHGQLFRCFDNTIKDLNLLIGCCIRVRASGLPASYDAIVMMSFFAFFAIAAVVWGVGVGWMAPIIIFTSSLVIMFLIVMGTKLVDPFGHDKVDIPLEAFCDTIESQIYAIDQRSKKGTVSRFARFSNPKGKGWKCESRSSRRTISRNLTAR
eukprot:CAMPEP_0172297716 /NCGR_PEP_ID=MMETSP1058-20130122/634_1 /TAXON_ID=83371 /ORGANISM="Detonula confervacea, Strain CCMP 353" /LENGTH=451 /DNA_ID=CAMNT_0013006895 /DNA_START=372 /DNA_END=1727 /DNA_ORIENTATION=-